MTEKRAQTIRRNVNDMFMRDGEIEPSKLWKNVGCGIVAYWMIALPDLVWSNWVASIAIASALIAPDVLLKIVTIRTGAASKVTKAKP